MTLDDITTFGIDPALALLPAPMDSPAARVMLLAICGQETGWTERVQHLAGGMRGPAHGLLPVSARCATCAHAWAFSATRAKCGV